ncbi:hypothetical protein [Saccharothrix variisporea]|uniref:Uncharacterized protein n=1 Tax=Saccharothrix variisporea TaxID=543527 RepID=A0A495X9X9_9PSEU|nr:hypothetical protein [Saccharothrix variisporea]RKT70429.1 hypothetical protein DFJ66_3689 [Saccharothrix variisporea]
MFDPSPALRASSLPDGAVDARLEEWAERLRTAEQRVPLMDLYKGEQWVQAAAVLQAAVDAGFTPDLWVASAGLGLQSAKKRFPAYAATFSPGSPDTVAAAVVDRRRWWKGLRKHVGGSRVETLGRNRPVLLILSEVYGSVLKPELGELAANGHDVLLIGGSADDDTIDGVHHVPADGALRKALGGTLTGLNARMAATWLAQCEEGDLLSPSTSGSWERWVQRYAHPERYNRTPMTDAEVKAFIRASVAEQPDVSRTRLHRQLRASGRACEQKRFANLFSETVGER